MKNIISTIFFLIILSIGFSSCKKDSYAEDLKLEKIIIDDFILRNGLIVEDNFPAIDTVPYKDKAYVKTKDGFYFRLDQVGNTNDTVQDGDVVLVKYIEYTLVADADTVDYWDVQVSPYLGEFVYTEGGTSPSVAFQEAVKYMKYNGSVAKLIVPYKLGMYSSETDVTPYGYDLKILFRKNTIPDE